jgi:hypothetical protein
MNSHAFIVFAPGTRAGPRAEDGGRFLGASRFVFDGAVRRRIRGMYSERSVSQVRSADEISSARVPPHARYTCTHTPVLVIPNHCLLQTVN